MSGSKKDNDDYNGKGVSSMEEMMETETGGKKDGSTPDYEKAMTSNYDQKDFDDSTTRMK